MSQQGNTRLRSRQLGASLLLALTACSARQVAFDPEQPAARPGPALAGERPLAPAAAEREAPEDSDRSLARRLGAALVRACPSGEAFAARAAEREQCAAALTALDVLRDAASDPVLWGAQRPGAGYDVGRSTTTQMNGLVLRRLYLSTFAFGPEQRVERTETGVVLHVASRFRQDLDPGDYPYPFWHSADKWRSYESTRELLFFVSSGALQAVLRSEERDPQRPHVERAWDGRWQWRSARGQEPNNALYAALFSPGNPHVQPLEDAYREFEQAQRASQCVACHDPSNRAKVSRLELFSYPNQALGGRHDLVRALEANVMPPATAMQPAGIEDAAERDLLLGLARRFAKQGDAALAFEGEPVRP